MRESTVGLRTKNDVIEYIQNHSINGKLRKSLMDIAEQMGLSNATIHRAMKKLESEGIIRVIAADKPTEPNTILYQGSPQHKEDSSVSIIRNTESISQIAKDIAEETRLIAGYIELLRTDAKMYHDLQSRIVSIHDMPDGEYQMIVVRRASTVETTV